MTTRILLLGLAALIAGAPSARAQSCTTYVNASDGDDGNAGMSPSQAFQSLEHAFERSASGTFLCIAAGEYFHQRDSDGIALSSPGKSLGMVLNSFAGSSEVLLSEQFLRLDLGSGTLSILPGTANRLRIGPGVFNSDSQTGPNYLNFVHTLDLASGTLDISQIEFVVAPSVGDSTFVNPDNPAKTAPPTSRIRFGDVTIVGSMLFQPGPRTIVVNPGLASVLSLSMELDDSRLRFQNSGDVTIETAVQLSRADLAFSGDGGVRFDQSVVLADPGVVRSLGSGDVEFVGDLQFSGSLPDTLLRHSGLGEMRIAHLVGSSVSLVQNAGDGTLVVAETEDPVRLFNGPGRVILGGANRDFVLAELSANMGLIEASGDLATSSPVVNTGVVDLALHRFSVNGANIANTGSIRNGSLTISGGVSITGAGILPDLVILDGTTSVDAIAAGAVRSAGTLIWSAAGEITMASLDVQTSGRVSLPQAGRLVVGGDVGVAGTLDLPGDLVVSGDVSVSGEVSVAAVTLVGDSVSLSASSALPAILVESTSLVIEGGLVASGLDLRSGVTSLGNADLLGPTLVGVEATLVLRDEAVFVTPSLEIHGILLSDGVVSLTIATELQIYGRLSVAGEIRADGMVVVAAGADLDGVSGTLALRSGLTSLAPVNTPDLLLLLHGGGVHSLSLDNRFTTRTILWDSAADHLSLSGQVSVTQDLALGAGSVDLSDHSVIEVLRNVSGGTTGSVTGTGTLSFAGSSVQTISLGSQISIPNLLVAGAGMTSNTRIEVEGSALFESGSSNVLGMAVGGELRVAGGSLDSPSITGGSLAISGGSLRVTTSLQVAGALSKTGGVLNTSSAELRIVGDAEISFGEEGWAARDLTVVGDGTDVTLTGSGTVSGDLLVDEGAGLSLGVSRLSMSAADGTAVLVVDGVLTDNPGGGITLLGSGAFTLEGRGRLGSLRIALGADSEAARIAPSVALLSLSGELEFRVGSLDTGSAILRLTDDTRPPTLLRNLSDQAPANGVPDGGLPRSPAGTIAFEAPSGYHLTFDGALQNPYEVEDGLLSRTLLGFSIQSTDAINSPPVFGASVTHSVVINGALSVGPTSVLILGGEGLTTRSSELSLVHGTVRGSKLRLEGKGGLVGAPGGSIDTLMVDASGELVEITDLAAIGRLIVVRGTARVEAGAEAASTRLLVSRGLDIRDNGVLQVRRRLETGSGSSSHISGELDIGAFAAAYLGDESELVITPEASLVASDLQDAEGGASDDGFLVSLGDLDLTAGAPIPRFMMSARAGVSTGDDLLLKADLRVTERLVIVNGDVFLNGHSLLLSGSVWEVDRDGTAFDGGSDGVFGDLAAPGGFVRLESGLRLSLGGPLSILDATLEIAPPADDSVTVIGEGGSQISVANRPVLLASGTLHLGSSDLLLSGSFPGVLQFFGGSIASNTPTDPVGGDWGEVVLGGGASSIQVSGDATVGALTLRGSTLVESQASTLTIGGRLVFGENGASLTTSPGATVQFADLASVVRRGSGILSRPPLRQGRLRVVYDLHQRSLGGGNLTTGEELAGAGDPGLSVIVNAGRSSSRNTVRLSKDVVVDSITVASGQFDLASRLVTLPEGGSVRLSGRVALSSPEIVGGSGLRSGGPIRMIIDSPFHDVTIASSLWPESLEVSSLEMRAGRTGSPVRTISLQVGRVVDSLRLELASKEDRMVLNGFDIESRGELEIVRGTVSSGPTAVLTAGSILRIGADALVSSPVAVIGTNLDISGRFAGLSLQSSGDINVSGDLGGGVTLILNGLDQSVTLPSEEHINAIVLSQQPGGSTQLWAGDGTGTLSLTGGISLGSGILHLQGATLVIPPGPDGFNRVPGASSHVVGRISRTLASGFLGTISFPVGSSGEYRPMGLRFESPLFSGTTLSVDYLPDGPLGIDGIQEGRALEPGRWLVTSSVNFGMVQPVGFVAGVPPAIDAVSLLSRNSGALNRWGIWGGVIDTAPTADGSSLTTGVAPGGLSPEGVELAVTAAGKETPQSALQFAHIAADPDLLPLDLFTSQGPLKIGTRYRESTARRWFSATPQSLQLFGSAIPSRGTWPLEPPVASAGMASTGLTLVAVVPGPHLVSSALRPGEMLFVHGAMDLDGLEISRLDSDETHIADAPRGGIVGGIDPQDFDGDVVIRREDGSRVATFRLDLSQANGESIALLLSGYHVLPDGLDAARGLELRALLPDGSVIEVPNVTASEAEADIPQTLSLRGNYPNPFNPVTTIGFVLPRPASVTLRVYDITGRLVATQRAPELRASTGHELRFDGSALASGVYLYRLEASSSGYAESVSGRFLILK